MGKTGGHNIKAFKAAEQAWADTLPITTRCADCPTWEYTGTTAEGRAAFVTHRLEEHGETVTRRHRVRGFNNRWRNVEAA